MLDKLNSPTEPTEPSSGSDTQNGSGGSRRRGSRVGTRSVSTLTLAQLERKRANDREAQRAIRQRNKDHIQRLEAQITELTGQHESSRATILHNQKLQLENAELRAQLEAAVLGVAPDGGPPTPRSVASGLSNIKEEGSSGFSHAYPNQISGHNMTVRVLPRGPASIGQLSPQMARSPNAWHQGDGGESTYSSRPMSSVSGSSISGETIDSAAWGPDERAYQQAQYGEAEKGVNPVLDQIIPAHINFGFLLDSNNQPTIYPRPQLVMVNEICKGVYGDEQSDGRWTMMHSATSAEDISLLTRQPPPPEPVLHTPLTLYRQPSRYGWEVPIRNLAPTCIIDRILLEFIGKQRHLAVSGTTGVQLIGPKYPSISSLLNHEHAINSHPVSRVLTDILGSLPSLDSLPEKVAILYAMYLLLRWQISPAIATYNSLPEWLCPRASQLVTPHPIWMDQIPWPRLRDRVINNQGVYSNQEFQEIFTSNISINWPHPPGEALVLQNSEVRMNPIFERHVIRLESWSLGPSFAQRYPELKDATRITE